MVPTLQATDIQTVAFISTDTYDRNSCNRQRYLFSVPDLPGYTVVEVK